MADKRLIDANELKRRLIEGDGHDDDGFTEGYNFAINEIRGYIADAPTIEAQPVKHGWWLDNPIQSQLYSYICSNCRNSCDWTYRYCPRCGAKMDLKGI